MEAQHQILRTLRTSEPALLATLSALSGKSRTAVSGIVCEQFRFYDARGRPQRAGCMKPFGPWKRRAGSRCRRRSVR